MIMSFGASTTIAGEKIATKNTRNASQKSGRSLASLRTEPTSLGQGEAMLRQLTKPAPRFMSATANSSAVPVRIGGFCNDSYGNRHWSSQKTYESCIENGNRTSGASVNDYFGPAQRQAGVGILVGK
jgi:hypothetical protein